ncbi:patatin-like phospholipase family protein [Streptomyces sp. NPDC008079]|uniref:patatin-like phospholipase family protein n=1 Tax=Streptomyces sp. NPDC008079 TaxID=3364806 RepID=UPI0036E12592
MLSVAVQGGAMRSIYALGVVRGMVDLGIHSKVGSVHSSSAGCVAGAVLAGQARADDAPDLTGLVKTFLDDLSGRNFIDSRRVTKMVDVDLLVSVIREQTGLSVASLTKHALTFEVAVTNAVTSIAEYFDLGRCTSDAELFEVLRATMAIPVLYHRRVRLRSQTYVDGGISDPLPLLRALARNPSAVIAVSTVGAGSLGHHLSGKEALVIRTAPGISAPVRGLMLAYNPLARVSEQIMVQGSFGSVPIHRVTPSDPDVLTSRTETDRRRLLRAEELGYADALAALSDCEFEDFSEAGAG